MLLAFLLTCVGAQAPGVRTVSLSLGAMIPDGLGGSYRYETVEDTYLDRDQPDKNSGGEFVLNGDRTKTILIRFGDLNRALGGRVHVRKAELFLTPDSSEKPELTSVGSVLMPWGEGPLVVVGAPKQGPKDPAPNGSATWRHRRGGSVAEAWNMPGAKSESDVQAIPAAVMRTSGGEVAISGLADAVQRMLDHPLGNYGFALFFAGPCTFDSSQSKVSRPRLELEVESIPVGALSDLSVVRIDRTPTYDVGSNKANPSAGEEVVYAAHVKNVGKAKAGGFVGRWTVNEHPGSSLEVDRALEPGQETVITTKIAYAATPGDPRFARVAFALTPKGADANPANDALEVAASAKILGIVADRSFVQGVLAKTDSASFEDWAQASLRRVNETYLPHSRFSFAPDGVLERYRLQSLSIVEDGTAATAREGEDLDAVIHFTGADTSASATDLNRLFVKRLGFAVGLIDLGAMTIAYAPTGKLGIRSAPDRFAGVMGGGDTRFDGGITRFISLPYEPVSNPIFDSVVLEPTDLFSATDVAALNASVGKRGKVASPLSDLPVTTLIKAVGSDGKPLKGAELAFFQSKGGHIDDGAPSFTAVTDPNGTANLPKLPAPKPNPFGALDATGSNGLFLIRVSANGGTEFGWLKAWQLVDAVHRSGQSSTLLEVRFNLPSQPLDAAVNLAEGRAVRDSEGRLPAKLSGLVDSQASTTVQLPDGKNAWVEVDLGRDRPVGEIDLVLPASSFWQRFDIIGYGTAQDVSNAAPWVRELDWDWTKQNRGEINSLGGVTIAYRGTAERFRYIRIVNQSAEGSTPGIAELRVIPVRS